MGNNRCEFAMETSTNFGESRSKGNLVKTTADSVGSWFKIEVSGTELKDRDTFVL